MTAIASASIDGKRRPAGRATARASGRRLSLSLIVSGVAMLLVSAAVIGMGVIAENRTRDTLGTQMQARLLLQARNLALGSADALLRDYPEIALHPLVKSMLARQPELSSASVVDRAGILQGHPDARMLGHREAPLEHLEPLESSLRLEEGERLTATPLEFVADAPIRNLSGDTIGRANLSGTGIDQTLIQTAYAYGVEVDSRHVFWANYDTNSIGRAKRDGSGADPGFIVGASGPQGAAVDWIANPGAGFEIVKVKRKPSAGTAKAVVSVPGPGKLVLRGKGLATARKSAKRARIGLAARPKGALKRKLAATGKAKVKARITFRPKLSSGSRTKTKKLSLRRS